jgi:protein-tyrosine phosphatase
VSTFQIADLPLRSGRIGICPIPGRSGSYEADLTAILNWNPGLVLTMTGESELDRTGASGLGGDLAAAGIGWVHLPVTDFGAPDDAIAANWSAVSDRAHAILSDGGKVLAHCFGGCGRSGMALLRLMVEAGEDADPALARLRDARPCAVETEGQRAWAAIPMFARYGWTP